MILYYVIHHVTVVTCLFIIQEIKIKIENKIKENKENKNKNKIKY